MKRFLFVALVLLIVVVCVFASCLRSSALSYTGTEFSPLNSPTRCVTSFTISDGTERVTSFDLPSSFATVHESSYTLMGYDDYFRAVYGSGFSSLRSDNSERSLSTLGRVNLAVVGCAVPSDNGIFSSVPSNSYFPGGLGIFSDDGYRVYNGEVDSLAYGYFQCRKLLFEFDEYSVDLSLTSSEGGNAYTYGDLLVVPFMVFVPKGSTPDTVTTVLDNSPLLKISYTLNDARGEYSDTHVVDVYATLGSKTVKEVYGEPYDICIYSLGFYYEKAIAESVNAFLNMSFAESVPDVVLARSVSLSLSVPPGNIGGIGNMGYSTPIRPYFVLSYNDVDTRYVPSSIIYDVPNAETPDATSFLSWLVTALDGFFDNFSIGGIQIVSIVGVLLMVSIVVMFLKMFAGG